MRWRGDPSQIELPLAVSPEAFRARLRAAGLDDNWTVSLTDNRTTMASYKGQALRVHRSYATAPDHVLRAIVRFVTATRRDARREASRVIVGHAPDRQAEDAVPIRQRELTHPADAPFVARLVEAHGAYNAQFFGGLLRAIPVRVSRRMRRKLGHYSVGSDGLPPEIAIGRRHIRVDRWDDVLHTLLHEMVHQWQDENEMPVAHDRTFRRKAGEVGIDSRAIRVDDVDGMPRASHG